MRASLKTLALIFLAGGLTPACFEWDSARLAAQVSAYASPSAATQTDSPRQTIEQWLTRAQNAMRSGEYSMADFCIQSAEKLAPQLSASDSLAYTPAQAREELAGLMKSSAPASSEVESASGIDQGRPAVPHLLMARRALAVGDLQLAKSFVQDASNATTDYSQQGDSPAQVQAMIDRQNELAQLAASGDASKFNHDAPLFLLQQADALIAYGDWTTAERVIWQAKQFPTRFAEGEATPDQLMARLNQARGSAAASSEHFAAAKAEATKLLSQAQLAMDQNKLDLAKTLTAQAKALEVPDSCFAADDLRPWEMELKVNEALQQRGSIAMASATEETKSSDVVQASYDPDNDDTHNAVVSNETEDESPAVRAAEMYKSGVDAMRANDMAGAKKYFEMAYGYREHLDAATRQSLQENMTQLAGGATQDGATDQEASLFRKLQSDVFRERATAERMLNDKDARGALRHLTELQDQIANSELTDAAKRPLLVIVGRDIEEMSQYIHDNLAEIEREETNRLRAETVNTRQARTSDIEVKVQQLVEQFERLCDEERYAEAEVIARQAKALAPEMQEVVLLEWKSKFLRRNAELERINGAKEEEFVNVMGGVEEASTPFSKVIEFPTDSWESLSQIRGDSLKQREGLTPQEERIWTNLREQRFEGAFNAEPLNQVIDRLAQLAGVNIIFDRSATDAENSVEERPITMNFGSPISIESALKLVIADAGLVFVVEDEVVKVTSRDYQRKNVKQKTYYVGDLVVPVENNSAPMMMNFMNPFANNPMGSILPTSQPTSGVPLTVNPSAPSPTVSPLALAQQLPGGPLAGLPLMSLDNDVARTGIPYYNQIAPQGLGGITAADFAELIALIQNVIEPTSWEEEGPSIRPYANTLSLIVTNTQDVHDQIQDLLEKLRELNDVQIVVEVRFITLQDNFFERIGVDFDFQIEDHANVQAVGGVRPDQVPGTVIIGRNPGNTAGFLPSADLDVGLTQNSFASAIPQFGGFDASTAANFGFAILSDIEVFFLIQASKGDQRTNVMQAPTVTLINGQTATVFDGSVRPFVTSLIPIVGDFAAAQQPVISWIPEGSSLTVRGTASNDRRFITMSLVPFFSQISNVDTFTFESTRVTDQFGTGGNTDGNGQGGAGGNGGNDDANQDTIIEGTTVQLPTVITTTVSTTVNVPDGGTVMIGGIKRLSEGRNERGVPFLSNIPYVNRLFKNVGIGRETSSLMMMVTPRIIIQKEEEAIQVGQFGG